MTCNKYLLYGNPIFQNYLKKVMEEKKVKNNFVQLIDGQGEFW